MDITIRPENACELDSFTPVTGTWELGFANEPDDRDVLDVEQSIRNYMDAAYKIDVKVFRSDGGAINGDCPDRGTFVAVRVRGEIESAILASGQKAIRLAESDETVQLNKYADPVEEDMDDIDIDHARDVVSEDPSLIYAVRRP